MKYTGHCEDLFTDEKYGVHVCQLVKGWQAMVYSTKTGWQLSPNWHKRATRAGAIGAAKIEISQLKSEGAIDGGNDGPSLDESQAS